MRKKLIVGILVLSVMLVGCGNSNGSKTSTDNAAKQTETENQKTTEEDSNTEDANKEDANKEDTESTEPIDAKQDEEPEAEENQDTIYEMDEKVKLNDWSITVTNMKIVASIDSDYMTYSPSDEESKFAKVSVKIKNNGKKAVSFLPSYSFGDDIYAKILYDDGYEFISTSLLGYNKDMHNSSINPLSSEKGIIAFEIPNEVAKSKDELILSFTEGEETINIKIR